MAFLILAYTKEFLMPIVIIFLIAYPLYLIARTIYRLYFHPLAAFPGPKIAACTILYEAYYDIILRGKYTFQIIDLHKTYGPIIRISPNELHISSPDFYEELYSFSKPRDKYGYYVVQFDTPEAGFGTVGHALHRVRRSALSPFFSKASILRLEPVITHMMEKLYRRLESMTGEVITLKDVYICLTTDVITSYAMNDSWNHLDSPDWAPWWPKTIAEGSEMGAFTKQFPWILSIMHQIPLTILWKLNPGLALLAEIQTRSRKNIRDIIAKTENEKQREIEPPRTIFHELLHSNLPPEEKRVQRLGQEAHLVIGAGAETTANTLTNATYNILANPAILHRLREELFAVLPDPEAPILLQKVETLPYLTAIINESLRLSYGVSSRLQRCAHEPLVFNEWVIPTGTPVGMTSALMHHDESIFPDSYTFKPERWFSPAPNGKPLLRYLVSFSQGSRQCIGINLARAELYLGLAMMFRRFEMELFDSDERDVKLTFDRFLPAIEDGRKGPRIIIRGKLE